MIGVTRGRRNGWIGDWARFEALDGIYVANKYDQVQSVPTSESPIMTVITYDMGLLSLSLSVCLSLSLSFPPFLPPFLLPPSLCFLSDFCCECV
jgi:hypothetical protein